MFVVMYDLSDMPPNSQTFLRQRTLYMPSDLSEADVVRGGGEEKMQQWLRYLIHLRYRYSDICKKKSLLLTEDAL